MAYTDEQIFEMAGRFEAEAPVIDYTRPGVFSKEMYLMALSHREARILQAYASSHNTTPHDLFTTFLSSLTAQS